ncbi:MAG: DUF58 domain-containing protein [Coriobacteriia bacterium]|nr:DUF58 domain-containing protein [Coriobacteriia bacterium]
MSLVRDTAAALRRIHVTPRTALLAVVPVPVVVWLPGPWPWVAALSWLAVLAGLAVADYRAAVPAERLAIGRSLPVKLSIGVANPATLSITNGSQESALLDVRETPPPGFAGERLRRGVRVGPMRRVELDLAFTPPSRGSFAFGDPGVRSYGPRRLAARRFDVPLAGPADVYPDVTAVRAAALAARKGQLRELGIKTLRTSGAGTEFESLRDYADGDDFRDIDWKATARRGAPVVRRFQPERSQTVVLAVDTGRMMQGRAGALSKLDRAVNAALLLAFMGTRAGDQIGLLVFGRDVDAYLPPRRGHRAFLAILDELHRAEGRLEEPDYARALRYLAARMPKRSLVVLFTDVVGAEPSRRLLDTLRGLFPRHLPLVVTQRNRDIEGLARGPVRTEAEAYRAAVAEGVLRDKADALALLSSRGSLVLDVLPERLSVASVNRYLEVKARGLL